MKTQKYTEMTAAFAIPSEIAPRFDLMLGYHPEELCKIYCEEDPFLLLRFISHKDLLSMQEQSEAAKLALLWLKYFPNIRNYLASYFSDKRDELSEHLWEAIFKDIDVLDLAYAFYPTQFYSERGKELLEKEKIIRESAHQIQRAIEEKVCQTLRVRGKIIWTLPFPANGHLGKATENKAGLSIALKQKLGLNNYRPGLLCNFLLQHDISIEKILDPYQFEYLTGMLFQAEGWEVTRMRRTRDGGKDIIAKQTIGEALTIAYIQAKRYTQKKIGIETVKEFVATVVGDKVDKGFIVTTSYFSEPSATWLRTKGVSIAAIELVDRTQLEAKIQKIADEEITTYLV